MIVSARTLLMLATLPVAVAAQHFGFAYIDIRLVPQDSVQVTIEADGLDLKNSVRTFPAYDESTGMESFRLYERRIESYLQQKVTLRADGKPVALSVVSWKPGGKGREDGFDTLSIRSANHAITLGGLLPPGTKGLQAKSEIWVERFALDPNELEPSMIYHLIVGDVPLRRVWTTTGRWVRFPVEPDSLAQMRKSPLPPIKARGPTDHSGHNH